MVNKIGVQKQFHLPKTLMDLCRLLSYSIWWQDERKGKIWLGNSITYLLARETASIYGLPLNNLLHYNAEQWRDLHMKNLSLSDKELLNQNKLSVAEISQRRFRFLTGQSAQRLIQPFLQRQNYTHTKVTELAGIVVSKGLGNVTGKVRIVLSPRRAHDFKNGEILVAPMTSPDYVPLMRKAKAVVTDVGGLMSHAAVVSRELGLPCIVATKIATKVLKDGDMVEVDANKGVVRKISR